MATPKRVNGQLLDGSGNGVAGIVVAKMLSLAFVNAGEVVPREVRAIAAADGTYSFDPAAAVPNGLFSNADLTPANTYWSIVEVANGVPYPPFGIVVPNTAGPFVMNALVVSSPALPAQYVVGPIGLPGLGGTPPTVVVTANGATDGTNLTAKFVTLKAAGGGTLQLVPGQTYIIDSAVIIPSGCAFDISGATLRRLDAFTTPYPNNLGQGAYMIQNSAVTPLRSFAGSMTAGSAVLTATSGAFTGADVGRTINLMAGVVDTHVVNPLATPSSGPGALYTTILSVQSATQATLAQAAISTVTGVTTNVYLRDTTIKLIGDANTVIDQGANSMKLKGIQFRRINTCIIDGGGMSCIGGPGQGQTYISPGDINYLRAEGLNFNTTLGGIQPCGPLGYARIADVQGTTSDDMVAFQGSGYGWTYVDAGDCAGPIGTIEVSKVSGFAGAALIHIWGGALNSDGTDCPITTINIDHIYGSSQSGIAIENYIGHTAIGRLNVSDVSHAVLGSAFPGLNVTVNSVQTVVLRNVTLTPPVGTALARTVGILVSSIVVGSLSIQDLTVLGNYVDWVVVQSYYGPFTVDQVMIEKVYMPISTGAQLLNLATPLGQTLTVGQVNLDVVRAHIGDATGATAFVKADTAAVVGEIFASGVHVDSSPGNTLGQVFSLLQATAAKLRLAQSSFSGTINYAIRVTGALDVMATQSTFGITGQVYNATGPAPVTRVDPTVTWGASTPPATLESLSGGLGLWGHAPPAAQPATIASPTAPSAAYVQAEAQSMKTTVDAISAVLAGMGAIGVYSPSSLPNLVGWYKADALALTDGTGVASWTDSSGAGNHAVQAGTSFQPTFKTNIQNGLPVLRYGATTLVHLDTSTAEVQPLSIFAVANTTAGAQRTIVGGVTNNSQLYLDGATGKLQSYAGSLLLNTQVIGGAFHSMYGIFDGASSSNQVDGNAATTGNVGAANFLSGIMLGGNTGGSNGFVGDLAEVVIVARHVTALEITNTMSYLKTKWATP